MTISFHKPSISEVYAAIQKELKDIPLSSMSIKRQGGIDIEPIYNEATHSIQVPHTLDEKIIFQYFELNNHLIEQDNKLILNALENGVNGLILDFQHQHFTVIQLASLFQDIRMDYIYTECKNTSSHTSLQLQSFVSALNPSLSWCNLCLEKDRYVLSDDNYIEQAAAFISKNQSQAYLYVELSGDYFWDISKIRAFKILLFQYTKQRGDHPQFLIIGETTAKNKSSEQLESNILKLTTEAMSAMIGGCEGIWIHPFDNQQSNDFSLRISRNIFHLMREESYMHLVKDVCMGSYFIENYTEQIARKIYDKLSEIENL